MSLTFHILDFGLDVDDIFVGVLGNLNIVSPYSDSIVPKNVRYPSSLKYELHYWTWSLNTNSIYNSSNTEELKNYEGDFYSSKVFIDGEIVYDTYYSKAQYDNAIKNLNNNNSKYITLGRMAVNTENIWHYSKMKTYSMRLYNRGLSEEEIIDNYNTTKAYYSAVIEN